MPLILDLDVADLAATRFAISPLSETITGLQQLGHWAPREGSVRWLEWAREELAARPLVLPRTWPLLVNERGSWPQFLLPAPSGPRTTIGDGLEAMQHTTARQVRASLHRVFGDNLPERAAELHAHPAAGLKVIAAELRQAHDRLIAPHWSRIRAVLEADIAYRSTRLTTGGAEHLFADLHPDLRWHHGRLTLEHDRRDRSITVGPGGLVLLPVALGPPQVLIKGATSTHTTLRYPARGIGTLWTAGTRPVPGRTIRLLGRHRAQLLETLRTPATTTDLAAALGVTASAVSQHLAILRESGLITGDRTGRNVFHRTTAPPHADWTSSIQLLRAIPAARRKPGLHRHRGPDSRSVPGDRSVTGRPIAGIVGYDYDVNFVLIDEPARVVGEDLAALDAGAAQQFEVAVDLGEQVVRGGLEPGHLPSGAPRPTPCPQHPPTRWIRARLARDGVNGRACVPRCAGQHATGRELGLRGTSHGNGPRTTVPGAVPVTVSASAAAPPTMAADQGCVS